jgi:hypothetical protein
MTTGFLLIVHLRSKYTCSLALAQVSGDHQLSTSAFDANDSHGPLKHPPGHYRLNKICLTGLDALQVRNHFYTPSGSPGIPLATRPVKYPTL